MPIKACGFAKAHVRDYTSCIEHLMNLRKVTSQPITYYI